MRYLPKSPSDREAMLKAIGLRSVDELFAPIPAEYRLTRDLNIPRQMAESEIVDFFRQRSRENGDGYTSFLGAGAYFHYRPVIIDALISRGEFLTAYTPYQAEISQGTLQSIFEFHVRRFDGRGRGCDDGGAPHRAAVRCGGAQPASRVSGSAGDVCHASRHAAIGGGIWR
jgi:glycine dehydrogenase subunit 1